MGKTPNNDWLGAFLVLLAAIALYVFAGLFLNCGGPIAHPMPDDGGTADRGPTCHTHCCQSLGGGDCAVWSDCSGACR